MGPLRSLWRCSGALVCRTLSVGLWVVARPVEVSRADLDFDGELKRQELQKVKNTSNSSQSWWSLMWLLVWSHAHSSLNSLSLLTNFAIIQHSLSEQPWLHCLSWTKTKGLGGPQDTPSPTQIASRPGLLVLSPRTLKWEGGKKIKSKNKRQFDPRNSEGNGGPRCPTQDPDLEDQGADPTFIWGTSRVLSVPKLT